MTRALLGAILLLPQLASAVTLSGGDIQANTYTTNAQEDQVVCHDANGNFVVAWESFLQDGDGDGVFGQRYASGGAPVGTEFQVNTYTTDDQDDLSICCDAAGNFVVMWESDDQDGDEDGIFGQRFDSAAMAVGTEFQANSEIQEDQDNPDVGCGPDGAFVVAWRSYDQDGNGDGVFGQRYNSAGMPDGSEFPVNSYTTNDQNEASVCRAADGRFVVIWESGGQDGDGAGLHGQRYASNGSPTGTEFQVNTYTTGDQNFADVACASDGNFAVVWESDTPSGPEDTFMQRYAADGTPQGTEQIVNTYTTNAQRDPTVCADQAGNFIVAWESVEQDGDGFGIFSRGFGSDGGPLTAEFRVNAISAGDQFDPDIACSKPGLATVAWENPGGRDGDSTGVFLRGFALFGGLGAPVLSWAALGLLAMSLTGFGLRRLRRAG